MSIKKIKRKFHLNIVISLLIIALGILLINMIVSLGINYKKPVPVLFNYKSNKNEYVYMTIKHMESIGNNGDKYYYNAFLDNNLYAIVSVTDEEFDTISRKIYQEGSYKLEGYLKEINHNLKDVAIEYYNRHFDFEINKANYHEYLNNNYLDTNYQPNYYLYISMIVVISILILFCVIFFCNKMFCLIRFYTNRRLYEDLESELNDKNVKILKKQCFCLTKNYLFTGKNYHVYRYDEILWIYSTERYQRNKLIAMDLVIGLKNGKEKIIWTFNPKMRDELLKVMDLIYQKNKKMLYKYSESNEKKYHDLVRKKE